MRKESKYPGYYVNITDDDAWLEHKGKRLKKCVYYNKVYWKVFTPDGIQRSFPAEDIIQDTFPGIERKRYIYALYRGMTSKYNGRTKTVTVVPGVKLTLIYSYMLETPLELDISQEMKTMFPGRQIVVEEGNEVRRWREIYFHSDEHMVVVQQKIADFLEKT